MTPTQSEVYRAAIRWCGQKDRETFPEDITYFEHNWLYFPGLHQLVAEEYAKRGL